MTTTPRNAAWWRMPTDLLAFLVACETHEGFLWPRRIANLAKRRRLVTEPARACFNLTDSGKATLEAAKGASR